MSTYKGIFGKTIKHLSSDPDNLTYEGQIWYNTTEGKFKTVVAAGAWSSSASKIDKTSATMAGTQTAAIAAFGYDYSGPDQSTTKAEEYNGSGWSSAPSGNTPRYQVNSTGTQTASMVVGGAEGPPPYSITGKTEEYDGTSWTESGDLPSGRAGGIPMAGSITAGLATGGADNLSAEPNDGTFEYDGTSWTAGTAYPAATGSIGAVGTQTAAFFYGGSNNAPGSSLTANTFYYDGSSFSAQTSLPVASSGWGGRSGTQTACLAAAANSPAPQKDVTLNWDGTSWTAFANGALGTPRGGAHASMCGATANSALVCGLPPTTNNLQLTEEYNFTANTVTAAAWASGGNMGTTRRNSGGAGIQTATALFGGYAPPSTVATGEDYDGSTWSTGASLNVPVFLNAGVGTQTAALSANGYSLPASPYGSDGIAYAAESDGSTWTAITNVPVKGYSRGGFGVQTAAAIFGGQGSPTNPGVLSSTQEWDGTNWTSGGALNTGRSSHGSGGNVLTAGVTYGGVAPGVLSSTEEYDGSSWTSGGTMNEGRENLNGGANGTQTASLASGGNNPTYTNAVEEYNGTSWSTRPRISTTRYSTSTGTTSAGLISGGYTGTANTNVTEEFTAESTAINIESVDNS